LVLGIDAATAEVYKAIKKMNYNERVWKVVAEYCAAMRPDAANKVWAKFIFCAENYREAAHFVRRAEAAGVTHVYYDFDWNRVHPGAEHSGYLSEEVADYVAVLRHECMIRGIVAEFAQVGLPWLTPERTARVERELERLSGVPDDGSYLARLTGCADRSDLLRMTLIAAQANLVWLTPERTESMRRELEGLNAADMPVAAHAGA